jgi:predicted AAA+ superfamily ATPase
VKQRIQSLLEEGAPPENVFYFPCDAIETPKHLKTVIDNYLDGQRRQGEWTFLFLDEISMLKDWQKTLKILYDAGRFENCTVILTGSHSIDLRKGSESLSGRRGKIEKLRYGTPDKVLLSAKFSEYVETLDAKLADEIRGQWLLSLQNRTNMIRELVNGRIPPELRRLALFARDLELLLDQYMLTGGISQAINQYISKRRIAEDTYSVFVNLMVREICRWNHEEHYTRQVLRRIFEVLSSTISWNQLKESTDIKDGKTAESYVNILRDSFVIAYYYRLNTDKASPDFVSNKKIYFQDPFIFHACRAWTYGKNAFDLSQKFLSTPEDKSKLVECLVGNHLSRFMFNLAPSTLYDPSNYVYYWANDKREVDFAVELDGRFVPIEVKYSDNIQKDDAKGIYDFMKTGRSHDFGIITSKSRLEVGRRYVTVPLSILLLLA